MNFPSNDKRILETANRLVEEYASENEGVLPRADELYTMLNAEGLNVPAVFDNWYYNKAIGEYAANHLERFGLEP